MASLENSQVIHHYSHHHPLELAHHSEGTLPPASCFICSQPIVGFTYQCKPCGHYLDFSCAQLLRQIHHPAHPNHVLTLFPRPVYHSGSFQCNACGDLGNSFCYHCPVCQFDLHVVCATKPPSANHDGHHHQLFLSFQNPSLNNIFECDVCGIRCSDLWRYRCDMCDFDAHLGCVKNGARLQYGDLSGPNFPLHGHRKVNTTNTAVNHFVVHPMQSQGTTAPTAILNGASGNQGVAHSVGLLISGAPQPNGASGSAVLLSSEAQGLVEGLAEYVGQNILGPAFGGFFGLD